MNTVGFVISKKENENRRALVPEDVCKIRNKDCVYIETGYGKVLGYRDADYETKGILVCDRQEILKKDIICDPKIGDAEYLNELNRQIIFGWVHAVQNREITDALINHSLTAYAWEDMFDSGRHVFWRNNEIAGEAAIMHAYTTFGIFPYNTKVAILGKGNIARGALKILTNLGAEITIYDRKTENLFKRELGQYDVIVNGILWDVSRTDHIINKEDLCRLKRGAMIIDISCDRCGAIETSIPTTIEDPVYYVDGIAHYVVDHTPSLFYKTISISLSSIVTQYLDLLIEGKEDAVLTVAKITEYGKILDDRINVFQGRRL